MKMHALTENRKMGNDPLFRHLSSNDIADMIRTAKDSVCYAAPGVQSAPAAALVELANRIGPEMVIVCLDFDERVMRMGYGDIASVKMLRDANIMINHAPALRSALIIIDREGYIFTPTALYLEAETQNEVARNALRLSADQVAEALARLSPAAKAIAIAQARDPVEKARIAELPVEVGSKQVNETQFEQVDTSLKEAPPVEFDLARQVRVFKSYLQYVELSLTGAAIQRHRLAIPASIQQLGGSKDLEGRLRTTFDLIEKGGKLSSKPLDDALKTIRDELTRSLGKNHGRVVLKSVKPLLVKRLKEFREEKLQEHQKKVGEELQKHLDESRKQIVDFYLPRVKETPPDALLGQLPGFKPTKDDARRWLDTELDRVFPKAESLIREMKLEERFKDVTFETLNREDFLASVTKAYPGWNWDKTYEEFLAAGENSSKKEEE